MSGPRLNLIQPAFTHLPVLQPNGLSFRSGAMSAVDGRLLQYVRSHPFSALAGESGSTTEIDLFDARLRGVQGAGHVLKVLEASPLSRSVNLSQNLLLDVGLLALLSGLIELRSSGKGGTQLREFTLRSAGITDDGLGMLVRDLLSPTEAGPPIVRKLYLAGNEIALAGAPKAGHIATRLGKALSLPTTSLRLLSLINNPLIGSNGTLPLLLRSLRLRHSRLDELHLSVCDLRPKDAVQIAGWLSDPEGGGEALRVLSLNGNALSEPGVRLIAKEVIDGRCTGMEVLELLANSAPPPTREGEPSTEDDEIVARLLAEEADDLERTWKHDLPLALARNKASHQRARTAACALLPVARVVLHGRAARDDEVDLQSIIRGVEALDPASGASVPPLPARPFNLLGLPAEIRIHILRLYALLVSPSSVAHLYPAFPSPAAAFPPLENTASSALNEAQFLRVLAHAGNKATLVQESHIDSPPSPGSGGQLVLRRRRPGEEDQKARIVPLDGEGAREWFLRETGCGRLERVRGQVL